ncbi:MAG: DUF5682 family protein [Saprospiraceae bacterium]|jgi:hypothetical protein
MEPGAEIRLFGIRHHGPGSARALQDALRQFEPDCILVEAPEEAGPALQELGHPEIQLPVALLIYTPQNFEKAIYLPFAEFSPECCAVRFALQRGISVAAIDLPAGVQLAEYPSNQITLRPGTEISGADALDAVRDPLQWIAGLSGYADSERWWEDTFEQMDNPAAVFLTIAELMAALREELPRQESQETLLREAWMRQRIRSAVHDGYQKIAVVCGAWHVPALGTAAQRLEKADKALLRRLKKEKVKTAWIPWSYERLALQSGYGAGVASPAWYELLFRHRQDLAVHWMVRAARLFRQEKWDTSPAHVQEAVRLAEALAALRGRSVPGTEVLEEAAISVLCHGNSAALQIIRERLVTGTKVGRVPASFAQTPLQQDLEKCVKAARLIREYQGEEKIYKALDLRVASNLRASQLLHRLHLLDIPWGSIATVKGDPQGSFREAWKLHWKADYHIRVIQAGIWGNTIGEAAERKTRRQGESLEDIPALIALLEHVLKAGLHEAHPALIARLQVLSAQNSDIFLLVTVFPLLARLIRYGNVRKTEKEPVMALAEEIFPRICIGLPNAVHLLSEEAAQEWFGPIQVAHQAAQLIFSGTGEPIAYWYQALRQLALDDGIPPLLAGMSARILLERRIWPESPALACLQALLSRPDNALKGAFWLEGFLFGNIHLLLHTPTLWSILDRWVATSPEEGFREMLPVLRRTFSRFSGAEREMLLQKVGAPGQDPTGPNDFLPWVEAHYLQTMPVLRLILGLDTEN